MGEAPLDPEQLLQTIDDPSLLHTIDDPAAHTSVLLVRKRAARPASARPSSSSSSKKAGSANDAAAAAPQPANAAPPSPHPPPSPRPKPLAVPTAAARAAPLAWPDPGSTASPTTAGALGHRQPAPEPTPVPRVHDEAGLVEALRMLAVAHYITVSEQKGQPAGGEECYLKLFSTLQQCCPPRLISPPPFLPV